MLDLLITLNVIAAIGVAIVFLAAVAIALIGNPSDIFDKDED